MSNKKLTFKGLNFSSCNSSVSKPQKIKVLASLQGVQLPKLPKESQKVCPYVDPISILQCNIGGSPQSRLAYGSVLQKHINLHKPTLITLIETKVTRKDMPLLSGYGLFTRDPLFGSSGGIAFYYKDTLAFQISKLPSSSKDSIPWVHLQNNENPSKDLYICSVYAPHAESTKEKKMSFYKELNGSTAEIQNKPGHVILVGDFNARLGDITGDHSTNSNKDAFIDFLDSHSLTNMNVLKAFGQYTFHNIRCDSRSIIDFLLTDLHESQIPVHIILPGSLGTSAQTGHKALFSKILASVKQEGDKKPIGGSKWRAVTDKTRKRFHETLKTELSTLSTKDCDYRKLLAGLNRSKTDSLGRVRRRPSSDRNPTPEIDPLDVALGHALKVNRNNPTSENLRKAIVLETQVKEARKSNKLQNLINLLDQLEDLHQLSKMRLFYQKIRMKSKQLSDPSFVIWNPKLTLLILLSHLTEKTIWSFGPNILQ